MLFGALGVLFLFFAVWQVMRSLFGVALFLGFTGVLALLATATLSDRALHRIGLCFVAINVLAAAVALLFG
jgi:hypothetical protein